MNLFIPSEIVANYAEAGAKKASAPAVKLFLLGILAGALIAFGGVSASVTTFQIGNPSVARLIGGLIFPFGLGIVILTGAELFTGNCLIMISVLEKKTAIPAMLRNWYIVYLGNFAGSLLVAAGCAFSGQMNYGGKALATAVIRTATAKCSLGFGSAVVLGILCNVLVCLAVLCSLSAKDTSGRILGAYIPVAFFVICGFEHSVADMYYVLAGLLAKSIPSYAAACAATGLDTASLTWVNLFLNNLLPITLGNILGGVGVGALLWAAYRKIGPR